MAAVTQMSEQEQRLHGHSPNKERYVKATRFIRELTISRAYTLKDELDALRTPAERDALLKDWAEEAGRDSDGIKDDLAWAYAIKEADLRGAFAVHQIPDHEWQKRIGISCLRRIGKAYYVEDEERHLTSKERAALVLECFHANWTVKELEDLLVKRKLRKAPKARMKAAPSKMPTTLCELLRVALDQIEANGDDKPLTTKEGTFKASALLAKAAGMLMGATFTLGTEGGKADA